MQHTMIEPARELPVSHTCDVLVCGGGIAGIAAALSAARNGADVLLLERDLGHAPTTFLTRGSITW